MNLQPHFIPNARGYSYMVWLTYDHGVLWRARCRVCETAWTPEQLADLERAVA